MSLQFIYAREHYVLSYVYTFHKNSKRRCGVHPQIVSGSIIKHQKNKHCAQFQLRAFSIGCVENFSKKKRKRKEIAIWREKKFYKNIWMQILIKNTGSPWMWNLNLMFKMLNWRNYTTSNVTIEFGNISTRGKNRTWFMINLWTVPVVPWLRAISTIPSMPSGGSGYDKTLDFEMWHKNEWKIRNV